MQKRRISRARSIVLIESKWNVNIKEVSSYDMGTAVLIESKWNVNDIQIHW